MGYGCYGNLSTPLCLTDGRKVGVRLRVRFVVRGVKGRSTRVYWRTGGVGGGGGLGGGEEPLETLY